MENENSNDAEVVVIPSPSTVTTETDSNLSPPPHSDRSRTASPEVLEDINPVQTNETKDDDVQASPSKKRPHKDEDDDDGSICPICLDNWTNTGDHRICSLKCGHLFGSRCIEKWLSSQHKKSCPTCKKKVNRSDLRFIYAKKLTAMDTSELIRMQNEIINLTTEKNRLNIEIAKALTSEHNMRKELTVCKEKIIELTKRLEQNNSVISCQGSSSVHVGKNENIRFYMDKSLEICKEGGCRVIDYSKISDIVISSCKSANVFGNGFGIRKINITNYKPTGYIHLHQKAIRDIKFHSQNPWILSVALDNTIKLTDCNTNSSVISYSTKCPLWSCCWDADNPYFFYVGDQQGSSFKYDVRKAVEPLLTLSAPGDMSPVVSVASIPSNINMNLEHGGLISCKLTSLWLFKNTSTEYTQHLLPIEGPFVSALYQKQTKHVLVSARPNIHMPYTRHLLCSIEGTQDNNIICNTVYTLQGGTTQKFLSRSCILTHKSSDYVAAYQESQKSVCLWSVNSGRKVSILPAHEPILDICSVQTSDTSLLVCLTDKKIEFFKCVV